MYEALAKRNPYTADSLNAFIIAKATQDPHPLQDLRPDLDPRLVAVIMKTLARKPDDRFPSVAALREALATFRNAPALDASTPALHVTPSVTPGSTTAANGTPSIPNATAPGITPNGLEVPTTRGTTPPSSNRTALIAGAALVALSLSIAGIAMVRSSGANRDASPPRDAGVAPQSTEVVFTIEADPNNATIRLDGEVIGRGRAEVVRPKDGRRHQVLIEADGYAPTTEVLSATSDVRLQPRLTPLTIAQPQQPAAPRDPTTPARTPRRTPQEATAPSPTQPPQPVAQPPTPPVATPPPTPQPTPEAPTRPRRSHDPAHPVVDPTNPFDESS
jgi:hypothetical protein